MNAEKKFLERLANQNNGILLVDDVIEAAKDKSCVLHNHFEWDDTEAANSFRREQARSLIRRCKITLVENSSAEIRVFTSLPSDRESGGGYRLTSTVLNDQQMRLELIHDIELTIARWRTKLYLLDANTAEILLKLENSIQSGTKHFQENQHVA
jgi:hypothetical protein